MQTNIKALLIIINAFTIFLSKVFKILSACIGFPCGKQIDLLLIDNIKLNITINVIHISITFIDIIVLLHLINNPVCIYTNKRSHFYIRVFKVTFKRRLFSCHGFSNLRPLKLLNSQIIIMSMRMSNNYHVNANAKFHARYNYCLKYWMLICQISLLCLILFNILIFFKRRSCLDITDAA